MKTFLGILCALLFLSCTLSAQHKSTRLTGAWHVTHVETHGDNPRTITESELQPSLLLFTDGYYSMMEDHADKPRPALPEGGSAKATAEELRATYGPITANSGTYEIKGGTLITHPLIAKNPSVMAPGAASTYSFKIEGNKLVLTGVSGRNGPVKNAATVTLTRLE